MNAENDMGKSVGLTVTSACTLACVPVKSCQLLACHRHGDWALPCMARASSFLTSHSRTGSTKCHALDACFTPRQAFSGRNLNKSRRANAKLHLSCGKNMLDVCCDPRGVTSTWQWSRPETNVCWEITCRHAVRIAMAACCAEVLFQPSFSLCCSTRCLWKTRHPTRWLWYGLGTEHAAYHWT